MTSPTSRFGLNPTSHEAASSSSLAKVYLRNFGKGLLELSSGTLKFYVEKGRLSKSKELSRVIPLADVESVTLEEKELIVTWKDTASRFVFEDPALAQHIYTEAHGSLRQPVELSKQPQIEEQEVVSNPQPEEAEVKEELAEKSTNKPDVQPEQVQHEEHQPQTQELLPQEVQPEEQKPEECLPVEPQNQELPEKREVHVGQELDVAKVVNEEVQKEPEVVVDKSAAEPEMQQEPTEAREIDEIAVDEAKKKDTLIVEQPKVALSLQEEKAHKPPEVQQARKAQENLDQTLRVALSIVDSLFDVLRSLQGRVNWNFMDDCQKRSEQDYRRFARKKIVEANLDFCFLSSATAERNVEAVSKEALHLLESLYKGFEKLPTDDAPALEASPNYIGAKVAIQSYYVLSDLILAAVVGDEDVENEINQLVILLGSLSNARGQAMNVSEMVVSVNKMQAGHGKETEVEEVRRTFRNQLKLPT